MHRCPDRGFTLVELLVMLVVLAVLAAIVLPKLVEYRTRAGEAAVEADLRLLRGAIDRFHIDTGAWPASLADLANTEAPAQGLDDSGAAKPIDAADWHGPYLDRIPKNPVTGADYDYEASPSANVGDVSAVPPASGSDD